MHRTRRRSLGLGLALAAAALALPAPAAQAQAVGTNSIQVRARCQIAGATTTTVWFGYTNAFAHAIPVVAGNNRVFINGAVVRGAEIEQFHPGTKAYAFSTSFPTGQTVRWRVVAPKWAIDDLTGEPALLPETYVTGANYVTTLPTCPASVSPYSASAQFIGAPGPTTPAITQTINAPVRNAAGQLIANSVTFGLTGVRTACSAGGTPLPPRIEFGYGGPKTQGPNFEFVWSANPNDVQGLTPLTAAQVIRTTTFEFDPLEIQWSTLRTRRIQNTQHASPWATSPAGHSYAPSVGTTAEMVWADYLARCSFNGTVVITRQAMWVDQSGYKTPFFTVTDVATQTTRPAVLCPVWTALPAPPLSVTGCDIPTGDTGPGSMRIR